MLHSRLAFAVWVMLGAAGLYAQQIAVKPSDPLPAIPMPQDRADDSQFETRIRGRIAFVQMINPDQGRPLRTALDGISS